MFVTSIWQYPITLTNRPFCILFNRSFNEIDVNYVYDEQKLLYLVPIIYGTIFVNQVKIKAFESDEVTNSGGLGLVIGI